MRFVAGMFRNARRLVASYYPRLDKGVTINRGKTLCVP